MKSSRESRREAHAKILDDIAKSEILGTMSNSITKIVLPQLIFFAATYE